VESIVNSHNFNHNIREVRFLDPNESFLLKAKEAVRAKIANVQTIHGHLKDPGIWPGSAAGADIALAVHVVYLMEKDELSYLIQNLPAEAALFVVLDAPTSVFTELWAETAKLYHDRAMAAHQALESHSGRKPTVSKITATIPRSALRKHPTSDWLLSLLCYRDMRRKNVSPRMLDRVQAILDKHTDSTGNLIQCQSLCYEFPALGCAVR
jgi:hypothetical protein